MKNLNEMADEELAMAYVNGDCAAFDLLLARSQAKLYSYILFVVHDREAADDIFQDTYLKVIVRLQQGKYTNTGKFSAWLMRIAHNIIMDFFRDQKDEGLIKQSSGNDLSKFSSINMLERSIEAKYVNEQVLVDVRRMMDKLPAPQREVVFMRFYQDMSFKEIAEATNVSINTALGRMRYAVLNLRRMSKTCNLALQVD